MRPNICLRSCIIANTNSKRLGNFVELKLELEKRTYDLKKIGGLLLCKVLGLSSGIRQQPDHLLVCF